MTFGTELLRCGGEKQNAGHTTGDGFDDLIGNAGRFDSPFEVVCLIDDEQIPTSVSGLCRTFGRAAEQRKRAEDELAVEEGIAFGISGFDGGAALLIEEAEHQIEAAQEFDEPLMRKGIGHENEDA